MKRNEPKVFTLNAVLKAFSEALNSLFFSDSNREFRRLKNFIAS